MINDIIILIWIHFVADFILQSDKIATNKSKNNIILLKHCIIYSIPMLWFGLYFSIINGILHFITDYFTSRLCSHLHKKQERHWFFVVIGLDQAIHMTTLILTLGIFGDNYGMLTV